MLTREAVQAEQRRLPSPRQRELRADLDGGHTTPVFTVDTLTTMDLPQSGWGRILADTKSLLCLAQMVVPVNDHPVFLADLPLVDMRGGAIFLRFTARD